ncbi:hypothetical protein [Paenibacillus agricola]|uniref:Uncharacterized protein n=1 Tax=Paenibacillus agricola TaxID=2716264 RepID=A0ABX0JEJ2_9BACL|nr:hypothetical protein [Paenibacillus agricola]NHN34313.1 hypothetical protein [Paenibacillus agricola]
MVHIVEEHVHQLIDGLQLQESEILKKFTFTLDGEKLSESESLRFINYLKYEFRLSTVSEMHAVVDLKKEVIGLLVTLNQPVSNMDREATSIAIYDNLNEKHSLSVQVVEVMNLLNPSRYLQTLCAH